jgi:threonine dehydratase
VSIDIKGIRDAAKLLEGKVLRTPSIPSPVFSEASGADVWLKLENLQHTSSFKPRGALIRLLVLDETACQNGVVAASAGNHAQGVAYHAQALGINATIVMPQETPFTKILRTEKWGAKVVLDGTDLSESENRAIEIAAQENRTFIHPYDDEDIIRGQGTVGLEFGTDVPDLDAIIIPIGGGGLFAGAGTALKALIPGIEIFGVEAAAYPSMSEAVSGGDKPSGGATVAEGIAVKRPGKLTRPIVEALMSEIFTVGESELELAVKNYLTEQKIVVEGAGAAPLAALLQNKERFAGRKVGLIVSGGNIDSRLLSSILVRGLAREGRVVRLRVSIADEPGALATIANEIGKKRGNIIEVMHQRMFYDMPVKGTELDFVIETVNKEHVDELIETLQELGHQTRLLSSTSEDDS